MQYDFMKNALLAILVISPLLGLIGTMVVNNKMAFFSDALGHSALTGIAIGTIIGVSNYSISMIIFAIIFALLLNFIKSKKTSSTDTIISVFSSSAIALGLMLLSKSGGVAKYSQYLIGDILSINIQEIKLLFEVFIITTIVFSLIFNKLLAISINDSLARSRGIKISLIESIFTILVSIIVMLSIKWVGILLINALLILPAAISRNISSNMKQYILNSLMVSLFAGIIGLITSFAFGTTTGPTIVVILAIIFFITVITRKIEKN